MKTIIAALRQLHDDVLENETRPAAQEIAQRLVEIEALLVAYETRGAVRPLPSAFDEGASTRRPARGWREN